MAPPGNRRSGYSRRAQYRTFLGYIAGIVGALIGAGLLIYSISTPGAFSGLRGAASEAAAPGGQAAAYGRDKSLDFFSVIRGYFNAGEQNAKLTRELDVAKVRLVEAQALAEENERLRALLGLSEGNPKPVVNTALIASTASSTRRFATIAAGSDQGVVVGMPVRTPLGLIGRVLEVSDNTARVLLITDTESLVPVRRASDGVPAFAQGRGDGTLQLRLINLGINPLKLRDVVVTSGSGGLYRPNTPVAIITQLTRDGAIARMLSDPAASEFVAVEAMSSQVLAGAAAAQSPEAQPQPTSTPGARTGTDLP